MEIKYTYDEIFLNEGEVLIKVLITWMDVWIDVCSMYVVKISNI